jgi:hypothetical protein
MTDQKEQKIRSILILENFDVRKSNSFEKKKTGQI